MRELLDFLIKNRIPFEKNVSGARLTSFKVGGDVSVLVKPCGREQLRMLVKFLRRNSIKHLVIGRGSDVLISDDGFDGAVISLSEMSEITVSGSEIYAGAGVSMRALARQAQQVSLSGLEFADGIPGSVGGGIYMNAGAYGGEISGVMIKCECLDAERDEIVVFSAEECDFSYRHSIFQENKDLIIIGASFKTEQGDPEEIMQRMNTMNALRLEKQPLEFPSAGSTFKRPENNFAGKLIEDAGLKGFRIGGACVSEKHAGFVINCGGATCSDVRAVVEHIKEEVYGKFGIMLECEIEFV